MSEQRSSLRRVVHNSCAADGDDDDDGSDFVSGGDSSANDSDDCYTETPFKQRRNGSGYLGDRLKPPGSGQHDMRSVFLAPGDAAGSRVITRKRRHSDSSVQQRALSASDTDTYLGSRGRSSQSVRLISTTIPGVATIPAAGVDMPAFDTMRAFAGLDRLASVLASGDGKARVWSPNDVYAWCMQNERDVWNFAVSVLKATALRPQRDASADTGARSQTADERYLSLLAANERRVATYILLFCANRNQQASRNGVHFISEVQAGGAGDETAHMLAINLGLAHLSTVRKFQHDRVGGVGVNLKEPNQAVKEMFRVARAEKRMMILMADDCTLPVQYLDGSTLCPVRVHSLTNIIVLLMAANTAIEREKLMGISKAKKQFVYDCAHPHEVAKDWAKWYAEAALSEVCTRMSVGGYVAQYSEGYCKTKTFVGRRAQLSAYDYSDVASARIQLSSTSGLRWVNTLDFPPKSWGNMFDMYRMLLDAGLREYLAELHVIVVGDHPMQEMFRKAARVNLNRLYNDMPFVPNYQFATEADELAMAGVITIPGPFHQGLNLLSSLYEKYMFLFRSLHAKLYKKSRPSLPDKPRPRVVHFLATAMWAGWSEVREKILPVLKERQKWAEVSTLVWFFETLVPLAIDHYAVAFKSRNFDMFSDSVAMMALVCIIWRRRNYDKSTLIWLAQSQYWRNNPQCSKLSAFWRKNFCYVDESFVERFNSVVKRRCKMAVSFRTVHERAAEVLDPSANTWKDAYAPRRVRLPPSKKVIDGTVVMTKLWILELLSVVLKENCAVPFQPQAPATEWRYLLPHVHGPATVDVTKMAPAYSTITLPSPYAKCDWCTDENKEHIGHLNCGSLGGRIVTYLHCGHGLCVCAECRRANGASDEEKSQCDICFKFYVQRTEELGAMIEKQLAECGTANSEVENDAANIEFVEDIVDGDVDDVDGVDRVDENPEHARLIDSYLTDIISTCKRRPLSQVQVQLHPPPTPRGRPRGRGRGR